MDQLGYALISRETLEKLLDLKTIFLNSQQLSQQDEGTVYLTAITSLGERYILKRRNVNLQETIHEFNVGIELSKIKHQNLINTYMYFQCPCDWLNSPASFILMEYAPGVTLHRLRQDLTEGERKLLIRQLCMIIPDIQSKIKFTHYDLHSNNILISMGEIQEFSYNCYGQTLQINSPFKIKIIDYGTSYVEGVVDDWVEINPNTVFTGAVPNVYDDFFDLAYVISVYLHQEEIIQPEINSLLEANSFVPYKGEKGWTVDNGRYYIGRERNPEWINIIVEGLSFITDRFYNNPVPIRKNIEDIGDEAFDDFGRYFKLRNLHTLQDQIKLQSLIEDNRNNPIVQTKLLKYQREYGGVMAYQKLLKISRRKVTAKALFLEIMKLTNP